MAKKLGLLFDEKECDYVVIVGKKEIESGTVTIRDKDRNVKEIKEEELHDWFKSVEN
jgi:histidyl-tRNA synthetase